MPKMKIAEWNIAYIRNFQKLNNRELWITSKGGKLIEIKEVDQPCVSEESQSYDNIELQEILHILKNDLPDIKPLVLKLLRQRMAMDNTMKEIVQSKKEGEDTPKIPET